MGKSSSYQTGWKKPSFLREHWDAALYGAAAVACIVADKMDYPLISGGLMCGSILLLAAEQFVFEKTRHSLAKGIFISTMMCNAAIDVYQAPSVQRLINSNSPAMVAPPSQG